MDNSRKPYGTNLPPASGPLPVERDKLRLFTTPLSQRGWPVWIVYLASAIGAIYLLNPGFGLIELIPDQLPLVGNLDEAGAVMLLWYGVVEYLKRRKKNP